MPSPAGAFIRSAGAQPRSPSRQRRGPRICISAGFLGYAAAGWGPHSENHGPQESENGFRGFLESQTLPAALQRQVPFAPVQAELHQTFKGDCSPGQDGAPTRQVPSLMCGGSMSV